jgi:hypothetical protein
VCGCEEGTSAREESIESNSSESFCSVCPVPQTAQVSRHVVLRRIPCSTDWSAFTTVFGAQSVRVFRVFSVDLLVATIIRCLELPRDSDRSHRMQHDRLSSRRSKEASRLSAGCPDKKTQPIPWQVRFPYAQNHSSRSTCGQIFLKKPCRGSGVNAIIMRRCWASKSQELSERDGLQGKVEGVPHEKAIQNEFTMESPSPRSSLAGNK